MYANNGEKLLKYSPKIYTSPLPYRNCATNVKEYHRNFQMKFVLLFLIFSSQVQYIVSQLFHVNINIYIDLQNYPILRWQNLWMVGMS